MGGGTTQDVGAVTRPQSPAGRIATIPPCTFNGEHFLEEQLDSLQRQSFTKCTSDAAPPLVGSSILEQSIDGSKTVPAYVGALGQLETKLTALHQSLSERANEIDTLRQALAARDRRLSDKDAEIAAVRAELAARTADVRSREATIRALRASTSWRITAPLRAAKGLSDRLAYSYPVYPFMLVWHALKGCSLAPLRSWRAERVILRSGLFDKDWYLANNLDVCELGINPLRHYLLFGAYEGRDPGPFFSTRRYLADNTDVATMGINPLAHYVLYGAAEGRACGAGFPAHHCSQITKGLANAGSRLDMAITFAAVRAYRPTALVATVWRVLRTEGLAGITYRIRILKHGGPNQSRLSRRARPHPARADIVGVTDPLLHVTFGGKDRCDPHPLFDATYYLAHVRGPEVVQNPWVHFLQQPGPEYADPHPLFDGAFYCKMYLSDQVVPVNPFLDYLNGGARLDRAPNPAFDVKGYTYEHPEVVTSFDGNALLHYVLKGRSAGKSPHPLFEPEWYLAANPDVAAAGIDPYEHYIRHGLSQKRLGSRALGDDPDIRGPFPMPCGNGAPRVSIIVLSYKSYFDTYRCLTSISRMSGNDVAFKVLLIDDGPDRPAGSLMADHPGIEVVTNKQNLGFLRACNHAARITSGEFILFLNNDTIVSANWLKSLVDLADRAPRSGMIGSKLLNYDGSIQEAGGVIFRNGWGYPYGRGKDRNLPEFNFVREVDCVTGACMLIRRTAFEEVGGFDDRFVPAFYEEFDFAFTLQAKNFCVFYQPASEVYHRGSASYGSEARDRYSITNHSQFVKKWSTRLQDQATDETEIFRDRERSKTAGTILIIDDKVPQYDKHAGALTIKQYMHLLTASDFKVIYWPHSRQATQPYTKELQQAGIEVIYGDLDFSKWLDRSGRFIEFVWAARPNVAPHYIKQIRRKTRARLLYYTHDLHWLREQRRYEIEGDLQALLASKRIKPVEIDIFNTVDCVTTPSLEEATVIADLVPGVEVRVLPPYFYRMDSKVAVGGPPLELRNKIIFVGGYAHLPNVDAAKVLVQDVMPLVWRSVPDASVMLVGSDPPPELYRLAEDRVEVVGYVPHLEPYYQQARMSVSPLRYGAGVKGKIISSLEQGVPVVTTPVGNEGIDLKPDAEVLVGETPAEIAAHVVRLFKDTTLLHSLADAGGSIIRARFSEEKARDAFLSALHL
jgi:GT2 family glycosyltransferase